MIDMDRIEELKGEIGADDLAMIIRVFLGEAGEMLANLSPELPRQERARAAHFLRSGALNIGFTGIAALSRRLEQDDPAEFATAVTDLRAAFGTARTDPRLPRG